MARHYLEVLKPRETSLITFIGLCAAVVAGGGQPPWGRLLATLAAILMVAAGANGLTNYLDRHVDARMQRTRHRALPSKRIRPAEKVLPLTVGLVVAGLAVAWRLHPLSALAGLAGTLAAVAWRKRWTCVFPQGMLASCAPVLMGWLAILPEFRWELFMLALLVSVWLPLHLWSVMIVYREDYLAAGLRYFPMNRDVREVVKLLLVLSLVLYAASLAVYLLANLGWLYLLLANVLGGVVIYTSSRLLRSTSSQDSWRLYKLSAFPYLGLLFLSMCLDIWLL